MDEPKAIELAKRKKGENRKMDDSHRKAQETRRRNEEARAAKWREEAEMKRVARQALQRVLEDTAATPAQILEAAKLLAEQGKP